MSPKAWAKVISVVGLGIYVGSLIAIHGSKALSDYGIFTYVPDDDDDQEDHEEEELAVHEELDKDVGSMDLTKVFGDYKMQIRFDWGNPDKDYLTMSRSKLAEQLSELNEAIKLKQPEGLPRQEADLAVQYLRESIALVDRRLSGMKG
ncbi:hypothetical protein HK097_005143 [Rhizophlyctis rosea]|uniref:Uncharacterized protein n=1 Tax=Rhizophlyctis rosea TaxID=64517 RepID=A0AAD5SH11_9FUNG|nr:hypothetical protein HK097_005143 [Rhizophlyctis rosea]